MPWYSSVTGLFWVFASESTGAACNDKAHRAPIRNMSCVFMADKNHVRSGPLQLFLGNARRLSAPRVSSADSTSRFTCLRTGSNPQEYRRFTRGKSIRRLPEGLSSKLFALGLLHSMRFRSESGREAIKKVGLRLNARKSSSTTTVENKRVFVPPPPQIQS